MPTITIQNEYNGSVSYSYSIFTIPELGATFPYYQGEVAEGTQVTLNLSDVTGCYVHTTNVGSTNYGHLLSIPLTMPATDLVITTYSHDYPYSHNKVVIGNSVVVDLTDASTDLASSNIVVGKSAYDGNGVKISGSLDMSGDNATSSLVAEGFKFHNSTYSQQTGTLPQKTTNEQMQDSSTYIEIAGPLYVPSGSSFRVNKSPNVNGENIKSGVTIQGVPGQIQVPDEYCVSGSLSNKTVTVYHFKSDAYNLNQLMFNNCTSLTGFENSSNINYLEYECCRNCSSLESVDLSSHIDLSGNGEYFYNCSSLTHFGQTEITSAWSQTLGRMMFRNCTALEYIDCTEWSFIPTRCFQGCSALTDIEVVSGIYFASDGSSTSSLSKVATVEGKTYMIYGTGTVYIYDATDPTAVLASVNSSAPTWTDTTTGATFTWLQSAKTQLTF